MTFFAILTGSGLSALSVDLRDKRACELALSPLLDVDKADKAEYHGTHEIDEHILHRIAQSDVDIAVYSDRSRGGVYIRRENIRDTHDVVPSLGVENDRIDRRDEAVLLHIEAEYLVSAELEEFPHYTDSHGEAERNERTKGGRKLEGEFAVAVEYIHKCKAERRKHKAVDGMEHRIPERILHIIALDLTEYLRTEHENVGDDLKRGRQLYLECFFNHGWDEQQYQRQRAGEHALPLTEKDTADQHRYYKQAQYRIHAKRLFVRSDLLGQRREQTFFLFLFLYRQIYIFLTAIIVNIINISLKNKLYIKNIGSIC